jgi:hypothetical protein
VSADAGADERGLCAGAATRAGASGTGSGAVSTGVVVGTAGGGSSTLVITVAALAALAALGALRTVVCAGLSDDTMYATDPPNVTITAPAPTQMTHAGASCLRGTSTVAASRRPLAPGGAFAFAFGFTTSAGGGGGPSFASFLRP